MAGAWTAGDGVGWFGLEGKWMKELVGLYTCALADPDLRKRGAKFLTKFFNDLF